jgi:GAF domain-containing protein
LRSGVPVVIEDVEADEAYAPYRHIAAAAGYRAVHATPLISSVGKVVGMLATHFRQPHVPSKVDMLLTGIYSRLAAEVLARFTPMGGVAHEPATREASVGL